MVLSTQQSEIRAGRVNQMTLSSVKPLQLQPLVPPTCAAADWRVRQAVELIRRKPAIQVWDIALSLNLSASRFRHLFAAELGMSPRQYLRRARLQCARELLEASALSVKEVTTMVGFNDISHFVRDYKTTYGHTPGQTRKISTATASTANK
jgi:transcriptional regulator GlxA family with amidase domain